MAEMNRFPLFITTILLTLSMSASAAMADTIQSLMVDTSTKRPNRAAKLTLKQETVDTGNIRPLNVARAAGYLPAGSKIDVRSAKFCSVKQLRSSGVCPSGSKLGTGEVKLSILSGPHTEVEGNVIAYNAKRTASGKGNVGRLVLQVSSPVVALQAVLVGHITKLSSNAYGYQIRFNDMALPVVEGVVPTMTLLNFGLEASKKKNTKSGKRTFNYFKTPTKCSGRWFFRGDFRMQNNVLLKVADTVSCTRKSSNS